MSDFKVGDRVIHNLHLNQRGTVVIGDSASLVTIRWDGEERVSQHAPSLVSKMLTFDPQPEETRSTSISGAEKGVKPETFSLIPVEALEQVARHYGVGAKKYAPHNWRAGYEWSKSYDALQRHAHAFWRGEDTDAETGSPHMAAVAFHALTLLTFMQEQPQYDDRYKP